MPGRRMSFAASVPGAGAEARAGVGARADVVEARDGRAVARKAG